MSVPRAHFIEAWNAGLSAKEMVDKFGFSTEHYVYCRATSLGLKRRRWKDNALYRRMAPHAEDIVYAKEEGLSIAGIAEELGVSRCYPYKLYHDVTG